MAFALEKTKTAIVISDTMRFFFNTLIQKISQNKYTNILLNEYIMLPLLMATFFLGSGLVYGHFRLFHLIGLLFAPLILKEIIRPQLQVNIWNRSGFYFWFIPLFLWWLIISLAWVTDLSVGVKHVFYILNATFVITLMFFFCRSIEHLKKTMEFLFVVYMADLFIGIAESLFPPFRWIIARQSSLNSFFGIDPMYEYYVHNLAMRKVSYPIQYDFLINQPSGFHWGPNQYGLMLALCLPFTLLLVKNRLFNILISLASLYMAYLITSRAVLVGLGISAFFVLIYKHTDKVTRICAAVMIAILTCTSIIPFETLGMNQERLSKLQDFKKAVKSYSQIQTAETEFHDDIESMQFEDYDRQLQQHGIKDGSISKRKLMILKAWWDFESTYGWGLGAGNSMQYSGMIFGKSNIHNFWLETLLEAGVLFSIIIALWIIIYTKSLIRVVQKSKSPYLTTLSFACLASLIASVPAALAVGTLAYQTFFWVIIALGIVAIRLYKEEPAS